MMKMQSSNAGGISLCVMTIMPTLIHASSDFVYIKTAMSLKDTRIIPIEFWNLLKKKKWFSGCHYIWWNIHVSIWVNTIKNLSFINFENFISKNNIWQVVTCDRWSIKCNQKKNFFKTYPLNTWNFCFIQAFTATEGLNLKNKMEENVYALNKQNVHSDPNQN